MISRRDLRLGSGLVLFTYLTLHLTCHALGLVSLNVAETALGLTLIVWHSLAGSLLLYGAAAIHVALALLAVYDRRTLRIAPSQALRIVLGLTMPLALILHFIGTRYAFERFGLPPDYHRVVAMLWAAHGQGPQLAVLVPGWLHGCMGLNFAFSSRRAWQRLRPVLFAFALLLPVLAGLGFLAMARDLADHPAPLARPSASGERMASLAQTGSHAESAYLLVIVLVLLARMARDVSERRRRSSVRISYPGRSVAVPRGWTVLEASRSFGIPHQSTCGGRARCTTCRVRVVAGGAVCGPPEADERRTLARMGAESDIRLACQLRPAGDISVRPLVAVDRSRWHAPPEDSPIIDRDMAVLFLDIRFRARDRVPAQDAIFVLGQCHTVFATSIERSGGLQCRYAGASWMALFGTGVGETRDSCQQAVDAARRIETHATSLVVRVANELGFHVEFSVGVHVGPATVLLGDDSRRVLSAFGDGLNGADSLQGHARATGERFVLSEAARSIMQRGVPATSSSRGQE